MEAAACADIRSYYCTVRFILASASPRRAELLRSAGYTFDVVVADVDESIRTGESPSTYVRRLAAEKSAAVAAQKGPASPERDAMWRPPKGGPPRRDPRRRHDGRRRRRDPRQAARRREGRRMLRRLSDRNIRC
jgi:hypothetical protein